MLPHGTDTWQRTCGSLVQCEPSPALPKQLNVEHHCPLDTPAPTLRNDLPRAVGRAFTALYPSGLNSTAIPKETGTHPRTGRAPALHNIHLHARLAPGLSLGLVRAPGLFWFLYAWIIPLFSVVGKHRRPFPLIRRCCWKNHLASTVRRGSPPHRFWDGSFLCQQGQFPCRRSAQQGFSNSIYVLSEVNQSKKPFRVISAHL